MSAEIAVNFDLPPLPFDLSVVTIVQTVPLLVLFAVMLASVAVPHFQTHLPALALALNLTVVFVFAVALLMPVLAMQELKYHDSDYVFPLPLELALT